MTLDELTINYLRKSELLQKGKENAHLIPVQVAIHNPTKTTFGIRWKNPNDTEHNDDVLGNHHKLDSSHPQYKTESADVEIDASKPASERSKLRATAYQQTFDDNQSFFDNLKSLGLSWKETNDNGQPTSSSIMLMRAKQLLAKKIEAGFDPFIANSHKVSDTSSQDMPESNSKKFTRKPDVNEYLLGIPEFDSRAAKPGTPYHDWINQTTHYEREGAYMYTCHSRLLNQWLRGFIAAKLISGHKGVSQLVHFMRHVTNMESAISKFELKDDVTVYRVMQTTPELLKQLQDSNNDFVDHGFMSTTFIQEVDPDLVTKFGDLSSQIMMEINVPKGKGNGMYVAPLSRYPDQCEFIIGRGAQLRVNKIEKTGNNSYHVKCDLVGFQKRDLNTLRTINKSVDSEPLMNYSINDPEEDKWERFIGQPNDFTVVKRK